jgi:hypothetical protein
MYRTLLLMAPPPPAPTTHPHTQGPTEIALGCEDDIASAEAEVSGDFMLDAPFAPLGSAGFYYVALPPSSALWMIKVQF